MKLIPVQVGSKSPSKWDETDAVKVQAGEMANDWLKNQRRPSVASADLGWGAVGFDPRWIGFDSADCAAALHPDIFHDQGAVEFDRFREGAVARGETAIVISPIGSADKGGLRNVFDDNDSVYLGHSSSYISGHLLPTGAKVRIAADLDAADKDLALRLRNSDRVVRWRSLTLEGSIQESSWERIEFEPEGTLIPILETELGEPVAAVWRSPDGVERRYIVPVEMPWRPLLEWLVDQALPTHVPGALRRARRYLAADTNLMTRRERSAHAALEALEAEHATRKSALASELGSAEAAATGIRDGLLYGTGSQLVEAVQAVLLSADIVAIDLDEHLNGTKNADLLCTYKGRSRLVEVKSASGNATERHYEDLMRHIREWPFLPGATQIEGGALIVNYQHRLVPADRSRQPFKRPEFLEAAAEPIVTSLNLFDYWREEDVYQIRQALFGEDVTVPPEPPAPIDDPNHETPARNIWSRLGHRFS